MQFTFFKIVIFTPLTHADTVRQALAEAGTGHIGNYDACSFSSRGIGRFRPLKGSNPTIGNIGQIEEVEEEKIEVICPKKLLKKVLIAVKKVHPYEEPAIDIYPVLAYAGRKINFDIISKEETEVEEITFKDPRIQRKAKKLSKLLKKISL